MTLEELFAALDTAPLAGHLNGDAIPPAIDHRRLDETHRCAFCTDRARTAVYLHANDLFGAARWLDMCPPHFAELRQLDDPFIDDAEIVDRYTAWRRA